MEAIKVAYSYPSARLRVAIPYRLKTLLKTSAFSPIVPSALLSRQRDCLQSTKAAVYDKMVFH